MEGAASGAVKSVGCARLSRKRWLVSVFTVAALTAWWEVKTSSSSIRRPASRCSYSFFTVRAALEWATSSVSLIRRFTGKLVTGNKALSLNNKNYLSKWAIHDYLDRSRLDRNSPLTPWIISCIMISRWFGRLSGSEIKILLIKSVASFDIVLGRLYCNFRIRL